MPNSIILIIDSKNTVVASNTKSVTNTILKEEFINTTSDGSIQDVVYNGMEYIMQREDIAELGWSIFAFLPRKELLGDIAPVIRLTVIIGVLELLFSVLVSFYIIRGITDSIRKITDFAVKVGFGNVKERMNVELHNKLQVVVNCINNMLEQIEEMTKRVFNTQEKLYKAELNKRQAELNALQSQINPYFLYNTLECIRSIAEVHEVPEIIDISVAMSNIFRYSIKQSDLVTLRDELECVKNYFRIIDIRFRGRFQMDLLCDESLQECEVIKMVLQPLVENAVYHGLERKRGKGMVKIRIHRVDEKNMECCIQDDGVGMDEATLEMLQTALTQEHEIFYSESKRSVGLLNINNRIRSYYGNQYGLKIKSEKNKGTSVVFIIPLKGGICSV